MKMFEKEKRRYLFKTKKKEIPEFEPSGSFISSMSGFWTLDTVDRKLGQPTKTKEPEPQIESSNSFISGMTGFWTSDLTDRRDDYIPKRNSCQKADFNDSTRASTLTSEDEALDESSDRTEFDEEMEFKSSLEKYSTAALKMPLSAKAKRRGPKPTFSDSPPTADTSSPRNIALAESSHREQPSDPSTFEQVMDCMAFPEKHLSFRGISKPQTCGQQKVLADTYESVLEYFASPDGGEKSLRQENAAFLDKAMHCLNFSENHMVCPKVVTAMAGPTANKSVGIEGGSLGLSSSSDILETVFEDSDGQPFDRSKTRDKSLIDQKENAVIQQRKTTQKGGEWSRYIEARANAGDDSIEDGSVKRVMQHNDSLELEKSARSFDESRFREHHVQGDVNASLLPNLSAAAESQSIERSEKKPNSDRASHPNFDGAGSICSKSLFEARNEGMELVICPSIESEVKVEPRKGKPPLFGGFKRLNKRTPRKTCEL